MKILDQANLIAPDYTNNTIANIPATIAALFGAALFGAAPSGDPGPGLPPLRPSLWQPLLDSGEVSRVVLVLVDGMGQNLIQHLATDTAWLANEAHVADQITSLFPSTTVNALSSLWTGAGPAQHGLVGLEMFIPELGVIGQMLSLSPSFTRWPDALVEAGLDPHTFLRVSGFAEALASIGVPTYAVKHYSLVDSALSKMHSRGVKKSVGIVTAADLMWQVKDLLESQPGQKMFISAYWPAVDTLSHRSGFEHPAVAAELCAFLQLLKSGLMEGISPQARRGTVILVTADHGQTITPLEQRIFLEDHPELHSHLFMRPAGEPRSAYLYARTGRKQPIINYFADRLNHAAVALDAQEALQSGLFGPPPHADETSLRIGDVVVTMRDGYSLLSRKGNGYIAKMVGRHGGLTAAEMEVPWFAFRLQ